MSAPFGRAAERQAFEGADRPDSVQMTHHQNAPPRPAVTEVESGAQVSSVSGLRDQFDLAADFAQLRGDEARNLIEPRLFARLGLELDQLPNRFENRIPAPGVKIEQSAV